MCPARSFHALTPPCLAALALFVSFARCSSPPPAVTTNRPLVPGEEHQVLLLGEAEQRALIDALHSLAAGRDEAPSRVPAPAPGGVRWSDVPIAAYYACDANGMAIIDIARDAVSHTFTLKTVEDYPGTLIVRRVDDERLYEAEAAIGRFNDHADRAADLLESFDEFLRGFGAKRGFNDQPAALTPPPSPAPAAPPPAAPHHP